ncbi:MAG: hypothetical protein JWR70_504 [Modestobacter sp.]|nr:hypothetical protein [Modestobacter sp.]
MVGQRPQRRDALHRGEGEVVAGYRHPRAGRDERRPEPHRRWTAGGVLVRGQAGGCAGERVVAAAEQRQHLPLGHRITGARAAGQRRQPGAQPHAGRFAALLVVGAQRSPAAGGDISGGHLPGQVGVPRPGRQLVQRHHRRPPPASPGLAGRPERIGGGRPRPSMRHGARGTFNATSPRTSATSGVDRPTSSHERGASDLVRIGWGDTSGGTPEERPSLTRGPAPRRP